MASLIVKLLAVVAVLFLIPSSESTQNPKTICYYESWVHWRQGEGKMDPKDIDSTMCTHMVYTYFGIDPNSHEIKLLDPYLMIDLHDMENFVRAKGHDKAMIAVGGPTMSNQFSLTAAVDHYREKFVQSVVDLLTKYGFDGVMIDWDNLQAKDTQNFVKLLDKFDEKFASTNFILGISVPATVASYDNYDIPSIVPYVDFINVITFDYAGPWAQVVGHASPFPSQLQTLEAYNKRGAPRSKLVMAVPMFARTWVLAHADKQEPGDRASGPGKAGQYTKTPGLLSYNELCVTFQAEHDAVSVVRDADHTAIYAIYQTDNHVEWISFEDRQTLAVKAKNITQQGYAGMSIYTLSNEDVHGVCGDRNPLLHSINANYFTGPVTEPPHISTITPPPRTTQHVTDIPGVFKCHTEGLFRDPKYCEKYYECKKGDFGLETTVHYCANHLLAFDQTTGKCIDRKLVPGC